MNGAPPQWIEPDWPKPPGVRAAFSCRVGGVSTGPFASLNLATHVNDAGPAVLENRQRLMSALELPGQPTWLEQVHGTKLVKLPLAAGASLAADGAWTQAPGVVCAVMVADCLPVLISDVNGRCVAAVHAGWRGLCAGILDRAIAQLRARLGGSRAFQAWLGPCIGVSSFEVGPEVRSAFLRRDDLAAAAFVPGARDRWQADLQLLAVQALHRLGIDRVYRDSACTYADAGRFFSYRRDRETGRMAALIWRDI